MLSEQARQHVLFGGYRRDLDRIHRGCYAAIIASTGWDSLTCSGIEAQASGLPLLASALPGLREAVAHERSGFLFTPDDDKELHVLMTRLLDDRKLHATLAMQARARIEAQFSVSAQLDSLITAVRLAESKLG